MRKILIILFLAVVFLLALSGKDEKRVDMKRVRNRWLSWYNSERARLGLPKYRYDPRLNKTALKWCIISKERGEITHKRELDDPKYYNYDDIKEWFAEQGLNFKNIKGFTFTENIAWGYFNYQDGDYTENLIKAIRSSFDMYMAEKNKKNSWQNAHYRSITAEKFRYIGLGIIIDEKKKRYYLTVHYATDIIKN